MWLLEENLHFHPWLTFGGCILFLSTASVRESAWWVFSLQWGSRKHELQTRIRAQSYISLHQPYIIYIPPFEITKAIRSRCHRASSSEIILELDSGSIITRQDQPTHSLNDPAHRHRERKIENRSWKLDDEEQNLITQKRCRCSGYTNKISVSTKKKNPSKIPT